MTESFDDELQAERREVHCLLGRCMLALQHCELVAKVIVANHDISGPVPLDASGNARVPNLARKTLGAVVKDLLDSFLTTAERAGLAEDLEDSRLDEPQFRVRMQFHLSAEELARTEAGLRELVLLRNTLVHHFLEQHDLRSVDGCRGAQDALTAALARVSHHFENLRRWADHLEYARLRVRAFVSSEAFRDQVVDGIAPDGTVHWPAAGIVGAVREAAAALQVDGWTAVAEASEWIAVRYPLQLPARYRCRSWRQVLHESRLFELSYRQVGGQKTAWYRERVHAARPGRATTGSGG